ncbi:acyl-CoA dehydrogenase family protein [Reyranella sp. CPCC 100927]|uniref:acyl-CoA dehydrogenase family protein n=1 Tax=Reyranella sp. CPCC 100927 TaxID=2599616 RepID=UPI0011B40579|nr:acyl-CoA dehydrogenase family protein [Reyranella sp. CPCC 100927]TWT00698.1 acyl-CoA dehydrogenase [Reyranella sp. CPCC 100927]
MTAPALDFPPFRLPPDAEALRTEIRAFLKETLPTIKGGDRYKTWSSRSPEFSQKMGARGWIGVTWPKKYGGGEKSFLHRYVITEELLANGAPAGSHWVADRQSGPNILRFGTDEMKDSILPRIVKGECYFAIGMSEPDSGSDLASVRTRADKVDGGWLVNGTKIWTSGAHRAHYVITLLRTSGTREDKHRGLSQMVIDLASPGITIRPIINLNGKHDWNEVVFRDCFVPDTMLLGNEGDGWMQVTSELAYERSGPERFLTNVHVLKELAKLVGRQPGRQAQETVGKLVARLWSLRQMSLSVAGMLEAGKSPVTEGAATKDLGTHFQQDLPEIARILAESDAADADDIADFLDMCQMATLEAPAYSIQGGTTQILRGIIARGLGLR